MWGRFAGRVGAAGSRYAAAVPGSVARAMLPSSRDPRDDGTVMAIAAAIKKVVMPISLTSQRKEVKGIVTKSQQVTMRARKHGRRPERRRHTRRDPGCLQTGAGKLRGAGPELGARIGGQRPAPISQHSIDLEVQVALGLCSHWVMMLSVVDSTVTTRLGVRSAEPGRDGDRLAPAPARPRNHGPHHP